MESSKTIINNRYDFVLLFDVKDGNPNGDPDAGNFPRIDAETGHGLVTDVCLKRKVRNFVGVTEEFKAPYDIYVKEKAVLGLLQKAAYAEMKIELGQESRKEIPANISELLEDFVLPEGMLMQEEDDKSVIVVEADADIGAIKEALKEIKKEVKPPKELMDFLQASLKGVSARKPKKDEIEKGRNWMCQTYYDIRAFGAVMALKSAPNCGQVRGPVQMTFARSIDPIVPLEHTITRMAVATEAESEKQSGDNRTMGRKHTVPYGLYVAHGFVSAFLARQTEFSEKDLEVLWDSLEYMFEHDRSAARGEMTTRGLYVFKHNCALGNAHAQDLFDLVKINRKEKIDIPRSFCDYEVKINKNQVPGNVKLDIKVGNPIIEDN